MTQRDSTKQTLFAKLPSVDYLLKKLAPQAKEGGQLSKHTHPKLFIVAGQSIPRALVHEGINSFLDICRSAIHDGIFTEKDIAEEEIFIQLQDFLCQNLRPHFRRVVNATGVVLHTNMGRAPLAKEAIAAVVQACQYYSNLEFDLATGERGSRYSHVEALICKLTGAEASLVVNNNAAAVFLILDTVCKGKEVIVSRGQLVEIGGSFRIPEVMEKSGCTLREVGATNRTHLSDYENAIDENTAALMRVHQSNFRIIGFQSDVPLADLVQLGHDKGLPVIEDLGSGYLADFSSPQMQSFAQDEPSITEVVRAGVDIISFSGDKILGGPQAGIIIGQTNYIERIKKNPLNRALRIDKMTLAALEATLRLYTEPDLAVEKIPTLHALSLSIESLEKRAKKLSQSIKNMLAKESIQKKIDIHVVADVSKAGGGSFPERTLPTWVVQLSGADILAEKLRTVLLQTAIPLVGRLHEGRFCLDVRTIADEEISLVTASLQEAFCKK